MRSWTRSWPIAAGCLAAVLISAPAQEGRAAAEKPREYRVWMAAQWLQEHPATFSRRLFRLERGTVVRILPPPASRPAPPAPWAQVELAAGDEKKLGFLLLTPPQRRAGELAAELGGDAAPSAIALATKALVNEMEKAARTTARLNPALEKEFQALAAASFEPAEVERFAGEGGLGVPERVERP